MKTIKHKQYIYHILFFIVFFIILSPNFSEAAEAKVYAVTTWDGGCNGATRLPWDNMADAWYDEITNDGFSIFGWCLWGHCDEAYSRDGRRVNGNMINSLFADASRVAWGNDTSHLDEADAALIALHGTDSNNRWQGSMRVNEAGGGDCNLRTDEMEIGDSDLEFLHLSSCHSMDDNMWSTWEGSMARMHQVDGFHGFMWIGNSLINDYENFASDAFDGSISGSWLDNMYYDNEFGPGNVDDQCPVAYAVGANVSDVINRLLTERYNHVYSDPPDSGENGNNTIWAATFIAGCDPQNENTINQ